MAPVNSNHQPQSLSKLQAPSTALQHVKAEFKKNCPPVFYDTLNTKIIVLNFNHLNFRNKNLL